MGSVGLAESWGDEVDNPDEILEEIDGGDAVEEYGENGDGVFSSKSDSGDNRDGSGVRSVMMNGLLTSRATLTTTSYVFAKSRSGSA
jgi:hypothetical protein